jgi:predicted nucleic acid-binding protein
MIITFTVPAKENNGAGLHRYVLLNCLANPRDQWHEKAKAAGDSIGNRLQLTTESVMTEFLNFFCSSGPHLRQAAVMMEKTVSEAAKVIPQEHGLYLSGLELYKKRPDKGYSLTDCVSMIIMWDFGITDVLTHDRHFTQEGFNTLIV